MPRTSAWDPASPRFAGVVGFLVALGMAVGARGMAGDEEPAHYMIARYSLEQPELLLSLAGRPFVNLVLCLPAQAGLLGTRLAAALATACCAYAVARMARACGLGPPLLAALFLLAQPFYLAHAATAMTEPWAAALLAGMLLAYTERRGRLLAMLAAVVPLARLEILLVWPLVAWVLWREGPRRWLWVLPVPLVVLNGFGALASGDPLWLLHQSRWRAYPEREYLHYIKSFVWIVGLGLFPVILTGLVHVVDSTFRPNRLPVDSGKSRRGAQAAAMRTRALRASAVGVLGILVVYSALAAWYPVTYGNLRYVAYAAPAFAILAMAGFGRPAGAGRGALALEFAGPVLALVGGAFLWNHALLRDFAILTRRDPLPLIAALGWLGALALVRRAPAGRWVLAVSALILAANAADIALRHRDTLHLVPPPEHAAVLAAARALPDPLPPGARLVAAHPVLAMARGLNPYDPAEWPPLTDRISLASPPGTIFFWDTHYVAGKQPSLELMTILQTKAWRFGSGIVASDSAWAGAFLVRSGPGEAPILAALHDGSDGQAWLRAAREVQYGIPPGRANVVADPGNDEYWRLLAQRYFSAGRVEDAWKSLDQAVRVSPQNARNAAYRAEFHRHLKHFDEATEAARDAVTLEPENPTFQYLMGRIALDQGRDEEAAPYLLQAARGLRHRWEAQFDAGAVLYELKRFEEAEPYFETATRLQPNDWRAFRSWSDIAWRLHQPEEALARIRAFSDRRPEMAEPYLLGGDLLMQMNRPEDARALWRQGLEKTGGDPEIASRLEPAAPPAGP